MKYEPYERNIVDVPSRLWVDGPDAHAEIDARLSGERITPDEAGKLHSFVDDGFTTVSLGLDKTYCDAVDEEIDAIWALRPSDLAVSTSNGRPTAFRDYDGPERERNYRIPDLHSYSAHALDLYLHPTLFRMIELIFGEPAIAFQSLYFEHGSMQQLHRDPMFVAADPPLNLCATWIALEDITEDSGPLLYVPGSHRLPWFEFTPGSLTLGQSLPPAPRVEFKRWLDETMDARGLQPRALTCKRGDAFIWHAALVHGGSPITNPERTRKSFVVHYSTAADYKSRTARMQVRRGDSWQMITRTTDRVIDRGDARGLDGPLRQHVPTAEPTRAPAGESIPPLLRKAKRWAARRLPSVRRS